MKQLFQMRLKLLLEITIFFINSFIQFLNNKIIYFATKSQNNQNTDLRPIFVTCVLKSSFAPCPFICHAVMESACEASHFNNMLANECLI